MRVTFSGFTVSIALPFRGYTTGLGGSSRAPKLLDTRTMDRTIRAAAVRKICTASLSRQGQGLRRRHPKIPYGRMILTPASAQEALRGVLSLFDTRSHHRSGLIYRRRTCTGGYSKKSQYVFHGSIFSLYSLTPPAKVASVNGSTTRDLPGGNLRV